MKIILLGTAYPYRGGLASYNERLAQQFLAEGHDIQIYTFTLQYPKIFFPGKSQFTDNPPPEAIKITRLLNSVNPLSWFKTGRRIRKEDPDILLIKYWQPLMAPCFGSVARIGGKNKTKVICIFDNVIPHEKKLFDRLLTNYFVRSIDGAIVMSRSVGEDLKLFRNDIPVIYNPHPLFDNYGDIIPREDAIKKLGLPQGHSFLLFFGFIRAYKGLDILLKAFGDSQLRKLKLKLIVAGEFYESDLPYRNLIKDAGIKDDVILFDRFIREDEVSLFFSAADLVVQPYRSATQSGVTQIAYHFGKPMLVTDVGGLSEIVADGKCGYVVKPEPDYVAKAIIDYFSNNRKSQFTEGVKNERSRFTWHQLTAAITEVYEKTVAGNRLPNKNTLTL